MFLDVGYHEICQEKILLIYAKNKYKIETLPVIHNVSMICCGLLYMLQYSSILAFFFEGESFSAHALSFNKPTTTPDTFFTPLRNVRYSTDSLTKAFLENSMLNGNLLPCEIFPGV